MSDADKDDYSDSLRVALLSTLFHRVACSIHYFLLRVNALTYRQYGRHQLSTMQQCDAQRLLITAMHQLRIVHAGQSKASCAEQLI
jgi:hypothetical protein